MAHRENVGISKWVSTGNETDVSLLDILEYYVESPDIEVAVAFIEGISDGRHLREIGRRALETETPILVIKAGDSSAGQEAIASHTGRISDMGEIYDAAFNETGIIRLGSFQEYLNALESFTTVPVDRYPAGRGLGVISASGGACALIADTVEQFEMELPDFPKEVHNTVEQKLPEYGSATNPVDATGQVITNLELFGQFVEDIANSQPIDAVLLQFGNTGHEYVRPMREDLYRISTETDKPIVASFGGGWPSEDLLTELRDNGIPVYSDPVAAIKALDNMEQWNRRMRSPPAPLEPHVHGEQSLGRTWRDLAASAETAGLDVVANRTIGSAEDAIEAAEELGFPVTIKLNAPTLSHKTEINGVRTDQRTVSEIRDSATDLLETAREHDIPDASLLVQEHVEGLEVVCGCFNSNEFGPVMMVGAGGVFVELFGDELRDYMFLPTSQDNLETRLLEGKLGEVIANYRGNTLARSKLVDALVNFGDLYVDSDVTELEANPIIVTENRAVIVDLVAN
jgi:acyl-CoA synthetase (NDP forming)